MALENDNGMGSAMDALSKLEDLPPEPENPGNAPLAEDDEQPLDLSADIDDTTDEADESEPSDDVEAEPETPAIDPPQRWTAEEKKLWSNIPVEAQRVIAAQTRNQERAIGSKAEEAASFRKERDGVLDQHTNLTRQFAAELATYAQAYVPQKPDYSLLATDPQGYAYQMRVFEDASAQHTQLSQRAAQAWQQAQRIDQAREQEANQAEYRAIVEAFPEWASEEGRKGLSDELTPVGKALGYDDTLMSMAGANDLKALKIASEWKVKAEKYDAAMAKRMESVRDAKAKPKVATPGAAQPKGSAQRERLQGSMKRLRESGDVRDAAAAFRNMG